MKNVKKIAICNNDKIFKHYGSWVPEWVKFCSENDLDYEIVDCYQPDVIKRLQGFDCLLWHARIYVLANTLEARNIMFSANSMGLKVFPSYKAYWHCDDKIAETYYLQTICAPLPGSWMFYAQEDALNWLKTEAMYPLVGKLRTGAGSSNVKLLYSEKDAIKYSRRMFTSGYKSAPSMILKSTSMFQSANNWNELKSRVKKIPQFLHTLSRAKMLPREKGYVFFQEFIPNDGYDLKIVVIGDKLSFIARRTRKGDFRASGGGDIFFDRNLVSKEIMKTAFAVSDKLGFECMGYDFVVDNRTGKGVIVEISYGFSYTALVEAGGFWDRNGNWHDEPLHAPHEVLYNLLHNDSAL